MFEGKILQPGHALPGAESEFGADGLRVLQWEELVARFGAARELRRVMQQAAGAREGSFDLGSARHLATLGEGQRGINPFALTNRKMGQSMEATVNSETLTGDRGRT
jgi:hypothetical protein